MGRRRKDDGFDAIVELVSKLPWWAGVALAVLSYLVLHRVALQEVAVAVQPGQLGAMVTQTMWKTLASIGQYVLPVLFLAGAGMSAWGRKARQTLVADVARNGALEALDGMSWREFEMLVGEGFRLQGYRVVETGGGGADGGVDLVLSKPGRNGGEKFLVQCKQWRAFKVGVDVVRELYGVMAARGATGGFVVTSGRFTEEAVRFASGRNVNLVDGPKLHGLIREAKAGVDRSSGRTTAAPAAPSVAPASARPTATSASAASPTTAPRSSPSSSQAAGCPLCSKPMVLRTARRGGNAGKAFWGCTGYPACRGTRPVA